MNNEFKAIIDGVKLFVEQEVSKVKMQPLSVEGVQPVINSSNGVSKGQTVAFNGGLFIAKRDTTNDPLNDAHGYDVLIDGVANVEVKNSGKAIVLSMTKSSGQIITESFTHAIPDFKGTYSKDGTYEPGDVVIKDRRAVILDSNNDWRLFCFIEMDELKGDKGKRGAPGLPGIQGKAAPVQTGLAITELGLEVKFDDGKTILVENSLDMITENIDAFAKEYTASQYKLTVKELSDSAIELSRQQIVDSSTKLHKDIFEKLSVSLESTLKQKADTIYDGIEETAKLAVNEELPIAIGGAIPSIGKSLIEEVKDDVRKLSLTETRTYLDSAVLDLKKEQTKTFNENLTESLKSIVSEGKSIVSEHVPIVLKRELPVFGDSIKNAIQRSINDDALLFVTQKNEERFKDFTTTVNNNVDVKIEDVLNGIDEFAKHIAEEEAKNQFESGLESFTSKVSKSIEGSVSETTFRKLVKHTDSLEEKLTKNLEEKFEAEIGVKVDESHSSIRESIKQEAKLTIAKLNEKLLDTANNIEESLVEKGIEAANESLNKMKGGIVEEAKDASIKATKSALSHFEKTVLAQYLKETRDQCLKAGVKAATIAAEKLDFSEDIAIHFSDSISEFKSILEKTTNKTIEQSKSVADDIRTEYTAAFEKLVSLLDVSTESDPLNTKIGFYKGTFLSASSYSIGDVVSYNMGLFIKVRPTGTVPLAIDSAWSSMLTLDTLLEGGGGGGGQPIVTSDVDLQNFKIINLGAPDPADDLGGVNVRFMNEAIAASSLYQGIYKPTTNTPDLLAQTDSDYTPPSAGDVINAPAGATAAPATGNVLTWFDIDGNYIPSFPLTIAAPITFTLALADGSHHEASLPPATYADASEVETALRLLLGDFGVANIYVSFDTVAHIGFENPLASFATYLNHQTSSPFPIASPGAGNVVLNTYSWTVSTNDPNVPEYAPPGIPGIMAGQPLNNSDSLQWSDTAKAFQLVKGGNLTQSFADNRYWQIADGNMVWKDQRYSAGAIVYDDLVNAWYTATSDVPLGGERPSDLATATRHWKQINSSTGTVTYFGRGELDLHDLSASNSFGLPLGTLPSSSREPKSGDFFFNVLSSTVYEFTVVDHPDIYEKSVQLEAGTSGGVTNIISDLELVNTLYAGKPAGWFFTYMNNYGHDATVGPGNPWAGQIIPDGHGLQVFSTGDPNVGHSGWWQSTTVHPGGFVVDHIPTTNPVPVDATVTATEVIGYRRDFTMPRIQNSNIKAYQWIKGIKSQPAMYRVTLRSPGNSDVCIFDVSVKPGGVAALVPVEIINLGGQVITIGFQYDSTDDLSIWTSLNPGSAEVWNISITTDTGSLQGVAIGGKYYDSATDIAKLLTYSYIDGTHSYPTAALARQMAAGSGSAAAAVLSGQTLDFNVNNRNLDIGDSKFVRLRMVFIAHTNAGAQKQRIEFPDNAGATFAEHAIPGTFLGYSQRTGEALMPLAQNHVVISAHNSRMTNDNIKNGTYAFIEFVIDKRQYENRGQCWIEVESTYQNEHDQYLHDYWRVAVTTDVSKIWAASGIGGFTTTFNVYED